MTKKKEEKVIEKHLVISLRKALSKPRTGRANKAVGEIKARISQHFRVKAENVRISNALNAFVWQHGIEHIPRKVSVKGLTRDKFVDVFLESEKIKLREKEEKKQKKETAEEQALEEEIERKKKEKKIKEKAAEAAAIKRGTDKSD